MEKIVWARKQKRRSRNVVVVLFVFFFLFFFSEYSKIFSSSGSELSHYSRCQYGYYYGDDLIGELVEAPFTGSSFLTAKVKLYYEGSVVRYEFPSCRLEKDLTPVHSRNGVIFRRASRTSWWHSSRFPKTYHFEMWKEQDYFCHLDETRSQDLSLDLWARAKTQRGGPGNELVTCVCHARIKWPFYK